VSTIHPALAAVTERITDRSSAPRAAYLQQTREAEGRGPARGRLACANLAAPFPRLPRQHTNPAVRLYTVGRTAGMLSLFPNPAHSTANPERSAQFPGSHGAAALQASCEQLQSALASRDVIGQAKAF
jgi:hypothetical protein